MDDVVRRRHRSRATASGSKGEEVEHTTDEGVDSCDRSNRDYIEIAS